MWDQTSIKLQVDMHNFIKLTYKIYSTAGRRSVVTRDSHGIIVYSDENSKSVHLQLKLV